MPLQKRKIGAASVTIVVLLLLIMAGPAQAFELSLEVNGEDTVEQGKKIELTATIDIDSGEALDIDNITLILEGTNNPKYVECTFDVTGKMKSGVNDLCHGINIKKIPYPQIGKGYGYSYGYNYGYGYGITEDLIYEITIHTQKFSVGTYSTALRINFNGDESSVPGKNITITEKKKESSSEYGYSGCTTNWECSEWVDCKNGEQTRTCKKEDKSCITTEKKPEEKQACQEKSHEEPEEQIQSTEQEVEQTVGEEKKEEKQEKIPEKSRSSLSRITGAVAAAGENKGIIGFVVLVVMAAGILTLKAYRKKRYRKKFFSYKDYNFY